MHICFLFSSVKSGTSLVPNKLLCYCRSSDRLHNMPHEANTAAGLFLQEFIFPDTEKLQIVKITSLTTQEKLSLQIKGFNKKIYEEVLVLVANVEDVSLNTINHIRIMIEEFEVTLLVEVMANVVVGELLVVSNQCLRGHQL